MHGAHKLASDKNAHPVTRAVSEGVVAGMATSAIGGIFGCTIGLPVLAVVGTVFGAIKLAECLEHKK